MGKNAIAAYVLAALLSRLLAIHPPGSSAGLKNLVVRSLDFVCPWPTVSSLIFALLFLACCFMVLKVFDAKGWHLKV